MFQRNREKKFSCPQVFRFPGRLPIGRVMTIRTPVILAGLAASCALLAPSMLQRAGAAPPPSTATTTQAIERSLISEINHARAERGLRPLARVRTLEWPARAHSARLLRRGLLVHEGPGGAPFWKRLVAAGYPANRRMAENLAQLGCGGAPGHTTIAMWLKSRPHRANLLDPRLRRVGVGVARGAACRMIVTADFGG